MRIAFFGCGFLATWLAPPVLKLFSKKYSDISVILVDAEKIDPENLENSLYIYPYARQYKATNLSRFLRMTFPSIKFLPISLRIRETNIDKILGFDFAICTFDNFESRKIVNDFCVKKRIDLLHVGVGDISSVAVVWEKDFDRVFKKRKEERVCERVDMIKAALMASSLAMRSLEYYLRESKKISYISVGLKIIEIE